MRSRSSSSVCASWALACSASCSSCALLVIAVSRLGFSRLLLGNSHVALNLLDGAAWNQSVGFEPAYPDQQQDQPDHQDRAADDQRRPWLIDNFRCDQG